MRVRGGLKCRNEKSLCGVTPNLVTCHRLLETLVSSVTFVDCAPSHGLLLPNPVRYGLRTIRPETVPYGTSYHGLSSL